ncbi:hypothetical protein [Halobacillus litoralis]|uniref:hypothetical protein n=1 Tax=Halobacillus litoralis TaxID=45668 RepID=UPI001CD352D5|nr:hypothetical protein [Halobacillus litoralis]MCA1021557.1 hypothetical protein [Halobacillus litoralis]
MELLEFKPGVFEDYQQSVKNAENVSEDQARRKMTRNMLLAHKAKKIEGKDQLYVYGYLWFWVKGNMIMGVKNGMPPEYGWVKDQKRYEELNKQLGIIDDRAESKSWFRRMFDKLTA